MTQPAAGACPRCGTAYTSGQDYCLECGLRLPGRNGIFSGLATAWARRGWYPGDWVWPVLVFLVLAGIGALAAILLTGNGNGSPIVAVPTDTGQRVTVPTTTSQPMPTVTQPPPTTTAPPATTPHPSSRLTSWPTRDGYTVILQSIPAGAGRTNAERTARQALAAGLPQVGVLDSGRYSSLHPGYFVVFSGVYPSNTAASAHIAEAQRAGFRAAYVRPITH